MKKIKLIFMISLSLICITLFTSQVSAKEISRNNILISTFKNDPRDAKNYGPTYTEISKVNGFSVKHYKLKSGVYIDIKNNKYYSLGIIGTADENLYKNHIDMKRLYQEREANKFKLFTTEKEAIKYAVNLENKYKNTTYNYKNQFRSFDYNNYFIKSDGNYRTNQWWKYKGKWYYFDGWMALGGRRNTQKEFWWDIKHVWYRFNSDSTLNDYKGWVKTKNNKWTYSNGIHGFYTNSEKWIGKNLYKFDKLGYAQKIK